MEQASDWATFDALMGVDAVDESGADIGPLAFYGRCSTEDNQDLETSPSLAAQQRDEVRGTARRPHRRGVL